MLRIFFLFSLLAFAASKDQHGQISVKSELKTDALFLTLTAKASEGYVLNAEAPWEITLLDQDKKIDVQKKDLSKGVFDLVISFSSKVPDKNAKLKIIAFYCSKDKSSCFRDVVILNTN